MKIIPTSEHHLSDIEELLDICFGQTRKKRTSYAIRKGTLFIANMSFVIQNNENQLIGSITSWPIQLRHGNDDTKGETIAMIMVGPIAIHPDYQSQSYGRKLVEKIIHVNEETAKLPLMMIGDPEYYGRFGFIAMPKNLWELPGPFEKHRLLIRNSFHSELPTFGILGPNIKHREV